MKYTLPLLLFVAFIFLTGCPLQTTNSVDDGSYAIPSTLTGKWKEKKVSRDKPTSYLIEKSTDNAGTASAYSFDSTGHINKTDYYTLIFSTVGNKIFVSAGDLTEQGYYIYCLDVISNTEVKFIPVNEDAVEKEIEQNELKAWLLKNKDNDAIYDHTEEVTYLKQ